MNPLIDVLVLATIGSVAGLIGGVVFLVKKDWARVLCKYAISFAAGVLLSVSLLHLIPEAQHEIGYNAFVIVLVSFLFAFFFEEFFAHLHHHEEKKHTLRKSAIPLVIFGDTIHNFIDGVAIAAAYLVNPPFGLVVAFATFLHETPHEIGDFGVLMKAGWPRKKTFIANFLSALATFPGAILTLYLSSRIEGMTGVLLAVSAGIFLYLGASDFLPELVDESDHKKARKQALLLSLGVLLMYLLTFLFPEH
ncbi:ZIP family metal transporter [Patescibacteria group bacterium]